MMMRFFLRSRISRLTVTDANHDREGSIVIDPHLMNAAGLLPYERVEISNLSSGARFEGFVTEGRAGSGEVSACGAASHLLGRGDKVTIACYAALHEGQILTHKPKLVFVDEQNRVESIEESETAIGRG